MWFFRKRNRHKSFFLSSKEIKKLGREIGLLYEERAKLYSQKMRNSKLKQKKMMTVGGKISRKKSILMKHYLHTTKEPYPLEIPNPQNELEHKANSIFKRLSNVESDLWMARVITNNLPRKLKNNPRALQMPQVTSLVYEKAALELEYEEISDDVNLLLRVRKANGSL